MTTVPKDEQAIILQLALTEASRLENRCQWDIRNMEELKLANPENPDMATIEDSIRYLNGCREGWQTTIRHIRNWQNEQYQLNK